MIFRSSEQQVIQSKRQVCQVSHSVCEQDYCETNQPIAMQLDVMIGPTNRKNWLTFGGDLDTHSGSLFHFPHRCGTGYFRRFISISHTITGRFSRHSAK